MKRKLSLLVVLSLCMVFLFGINANADVDIDQKAATLHALGVLDQNKEALTSYADKGNALCAVMDIFANIECTEPKPIYPSIGDSSVYYKDVFVAESMGIRLSDTGDFNPNEYVTAEEFAKMFLVASGYSFVTEKYALDQYPYTMAANNIKVYGRKFFGSEKLTYGDIYEALYNLLEAPSPEMYIKNGYVSYNNANRPTIAETCLGVVAKEGVVVGTHYTNIRKSEFIKENAIQIYTNDGEYVTIYDAEDFYYLLGYNCMAYYNEVSGKNIMVTAVPKDNNEIYIDGDDLVNVDKSSLTVYYNETKSETRFDKKEYDREKKIPYNADLIFNGQYTDNAGYVFDLLSDPKDMNIDFVKLVDNDADGKTDVVIADVYQNFAIKNITKNNNTYSFTSTKYDVITIDDNKNYYSITIDGKAGEYQKFAANMLLAIKIGLGEKPLVTLDATNENFLGRFYTLTKDENGKCLAEISVGEATERGTTVIGSYVGGVDNQLHIAQYELDNGMNLASDEILLGNHLYRIFVDKRGKICALGVYSSTDLMWYMSDFGANTYSTIQFGIGVGVAKKSNLSHILKLKVATIKKELRNVTLETYETSKNLKILNIPDSIIEQYGPDWKLYSAEALDELFLEQVFEISFDSDGLINKITFPFDEITEGRLSYFNQPGQTFVYKAYILRSLSSDDYLYEYAKHMCIQIPKAGTDPGLEQLYRFCYFNNNTFVENGLYKINAYTFSKSSYMPEIMVMTNDYSRLAVDDRIKNTSIGVVSKAYKISGENGPTDVQEVFGMSGVSQLGKAAVLMNVYDKTYKIGNASQASDKVTMGGVSHYFSTKLTDMETYEDDPIDYGDIVLYDTAVFTTAYSAVRHYKGALKMYDYSTKSISCEQSGSANKTTSVVKGKIKAVGDGFFSLAVEGRGDSMDELLDMRSDNGAAYRVYVFEPMDRLGKGNVTVGERVDLEEAKANNWDVVIVARKLIIIYKD